MVYSHLTQVIEHIEVIIESPNYTVPILQKWQYEAVGSFLVVSGFMAGSIALVTLYTYFKCRSVLWTPSALPEIGIILGDLTIAGLHPFAGAAALKGWWIFGSGGCQVYAISGFTFGSFLLTCVAFVAFDRYILECTPSFGGFRTFNNYRKVIAVLFINAVFWGAAPAIGWAKFKNTPVKISCTIDWIVPDTSMITYNIAYACVVGVAPILVGAICYLRIYVNLKKEKKVIHWLHQGWEGPIMLGCCFVPLITYCFYVVVVFWSIIGNPMDIPQEVEIMPPVVAKLGGIFNPIFYLIGNKKLFHCLKKTLGFKHDATIVVYDEDDVVNVESEFEMVSVSQRQPMVE